uniref:Putative secreted peptide n=1 Tax=Anopheles braziliensis TaxID=58242 RepID=A0A2M3ZPS1_9DIPT
MSAIAIFGVHFHHVVVVTAIAASATGAAHTVTMMSMTVVMPATAVMPMMSMIPSTVMMRTTAIRFAAGFTRMFATAAAGAAGRLLCTIRFTLTCLLSQRLECHGRRYKARRG